MRPVHLCAEPARRLLDVRILRAEPDGVDGLLQVRATSSDQSAIVRFTVEETGDTAEARAGESSALRVRNPRLWDLGRPNLYHLRTELLENGHVTDSFRLHFGFRSLRIDGDRFLLNGRPVYFKGFGRHEDMPVTGRGFCEAFHVRDIELLRWCGGNSFRTAHYPHASEFLDLADRSGVLIIGESPAVSMIPSACGPETLDLHIQTVREMIRRDAHHPCVVAWCLANEPHSHTPEAVPYFEKVFAAARREDSTRPMTIVMCRFPGEKCHHLCDFIGLNAYPGWYGGGARLEETRVYFSRLLDEVRTITGKPVFMTEFGADAMAGLHSLPASLWTEDYQSELLGTLLDVLAEKDYIIGEHIWALADFHTAQNHFRAHGNRKGLFTRDRQPKSAAHLVQQRWSPPPNGVPLPPAFSTSAHNQKAISIFQRMAASPPGRMGSHPFAIGEIGSSASLPKDNDLGDCGEGGIDSGPSPGLALRATLCAVLLRRARACVSKNGGSAAWMDGFSSLRSFFESTTSIWR